MPRSLPTLRCAAQHAATSATPSLIPSGSEGLVLTEKLSRWRWKSEDRKGGLATLSADWLMAHSDATDRDANDPEADRTTHIGTRCAVGRAAHWP
jgi:hypothetical protein